MMPAIRTLIFPWITVAKALFQPLIVKEQASLVRVFLPLVVILIAGWFVTVPIHELLHVAGCLISGGDVMELTIQPMYGGTLLSRVFSFVSPGGDYAGQLKGFDTGGNDVCYFITVLFPFLLTIFFGFSLLSLAARSGYPLWHGIGVVHTILPIASITGDYYEMGSIVMTRILGYLPGSDQAELFRGDDLPLVFSRVWEAAPPYGTLIVISAALLGVAFIALTLDLSILFARLILRNNKKTP
jgi:multidrug transporter EmrE-like cation transporter